MRILAVMAIASFLALPAISFAQPKTIKGFIAAGPGVGAEFEGSEDKEFRPLIFGRLQWREYFFEIQGARARANLLSLKIISSNNSIAIQAGPALGFRLERDDVENDRVDSLRDVDNALEAGGFIGIEAKGVFRERDVLLGRIEVVQDVTDTHDGLLATLRGSYAMPITQSWRIAFGAQTTYASEEYFDTYFSIDADNAARSGLAVFEADEGFKDIGVDLSLTYALNERWSVLTFARYTRLLGDAADSPIVDDEGSPNQFFAGIAISYRF